MSGKIEEATIILRELGLPKGQQNDRSALALLALLKITEDSDWSEASQPMLGVTPIMDWVNQTYNRSYAPNSRETFRRFTLHQFCSAGLCIYNPDDPARAVNSPKACYQITVEALRVIRTFGAPEWDRELAGWLEFRETLREHYKMPREMKKIPIEYGQQNIVLSPGEHSELIKEILMEFGPRFSPGAELLYIGDTGAKTDFFNESVFKELGINLNEKGKLPDVVLYLRNKNWLYLIESVTSHGPVDHKRYDELKILFENVNAGLIFVSAFPDKKRMKRFISDVSWETEIWIADNPTHLMHLNGNKFLGPY